MTRERLQADLWPEMSPSRASGNLRVALSHLRSAIEPRRVRDAEGSLLVVDRSAVAIAPTGLEAWDVTLLRASLDRAREAVHVGDAAAARDEVRALQVLFAPFLPELYDDWVVEFRAALDRERVEAAERLAVAWRERGESALAASHARLAERIEF